MKDHQGMKIIGIDNGYGNIKTANCCFPAGLTVHDAEPVFKDDLLVYDGRYYLIGTGHKEFKADKTGDDGYYILTLAAIARELNVYGLTDATVYLAVGLPLTWGKPTGWRSPGWMCFPRASRRWPARSGTSRA